MHELIQIVVWGAIIGAPLLGFCVGYKLGHQK